MRRTIASGTGHEYAPERDRELNRNAIRDHHERAHESID
jgi:hypothetical protein